MDRLQLLPSALVVVAAETLKDIGLVWGLLFRRDLLTIVDALVVLSRFVMCVGKLLHQLALAVGHEVLRSHLLATLLVNGLAADTHSNRYRTHARVVSLVSALLVKRAVGSG